MNLLGIIFASERSDIKLNVGDNKIEAVEFDTEDGMLNVTKIAVCNF